MQDRRDFLKTGFSVAAAGLAGAAALVRARGSVAEEAPPETTSVRLLYWNDTTCLAPLDILDDLLRDEGFADVRYVLGADSDIGAERVARGDVDFVQDFAATTILSIDAGVPAVMLAGVHPACFELFARESIRSVVDLKGKTVGVTDATAGAATMSCSSIIAASVGLDPAKDINWVCHRSGAIKSDLLTERQDRCVHDLSASGAGTARPRNRPRDSQQCAGPAVVAVFLLHVDRQRRFCPPQPDRDQARRARDAEGDGHLRRQARLGRAAPGRSRLYAALRLRAAGAGRRLLSQPGANTTPRTQSVSTRCVCANSA